MYKTGSHWTSAQKVLLAYYLSLTCLLIDLLTGLLTRSLTYLLTHSLTYLLTYSLTHRNYYVEVDGVKKRHNTTCICSRSRGTKGLVCYNCEQVGCNGLTCEPQICRVRIEPLAVDNHFLESDTKGAPAHYSSESES